MDYSSLAAYDWLMSAGSKSGKDGKAPALKDESRGRFTLETTMRFKPGDRVRPAGDGESPRGYRLRWSAETGTVTATWTEGKHERAEVHWDHPWMTSGYARSMDSELLLAA